MAIIELTDTPQSMLIKMSKGNPGSLNIMLDIIKKHPAIDPQALMGGIGAIMLLDTWEIYGTDIYILWNDKCGQDVRKLLVLLRATQLGFFSHIKLQEMAADQMREVNITAEEFTELDERVCEQLEDFQKPE